jgi:hypothetical protein
VYCYTPYQDGGDALCSLFVGCCDVLPLLFVGAGVWLVGHVCGWWGMVLGRCGRLWGDFYSPPLTLTGIPLQSQNSARLFTEFDIPKEWAQNIVGIAFLLLFLVSPDRVPPDSVKKIQNLWNVW